MQQKHLADQQQIYQLTLRLFQNARTEYPDVLKCAAELAAARRACTTTRADRIKACGDVVKDAEEFVEYIKERKAAARGTELAVQMAEAFLLESRIELENVKTGE